MAAPGSGRSPEVYRPGSRIPSARRAPLPPVTGRPDREAAHTVQHWPDAWPAKAARHRRERNANRNQLKVPGASVARGAAGIPMPPCIIPSSQHGAGPIIGPAPGPQGSQTGPQGAPMTGPGAARCPQGERNSMNDGRRQLLPPPKQLLHPGAAVRADRASAKQTNRDMTKTSRQGRRSGCRRGPTSCEMRASSATTPLAKYLMIWARRSVSPV